MSKKRTPSSRVSQECPSPPAPPDLEAPGIQPLLELIRILRGPAGCPWDREQTLTKTSPNLIEEAHEVASAIAAGAPQRLCEELGDLLFQVAFVAILADDEGLFSFEQVVRSVTSKMVARHPHVFEGDGRELSAEDVKRRWQEQKRDQEKEGSTIQSILEGIPASMPPLVAAYRMSEKAAGLGFDWPSAESVFDKLSEEIDELRTAIIDSTSTNESAQDEIEEELGDLLLTVVNLARHLDRDPTSALARANQKFRHRFAYVEERMGERRDLGFLEELWSEAKDRESD